MNDKKRYSTTLILTTVGTLIGAGTIIALAGSTAWGVSAAVLLLATLLVVTSYTDLKSHRIPNLATYSAFLAALTINAVGSWSGSPDLQTRLGGIGIGNCLAGAAASFGIMLLAYILFGSGAGDVKLATAIGALMGINFGIRTIIWCHLLAALFVIVWSLCRRDLWVLASSLLRSLGHKLFPAWVLPPTKRQQVKLTTPIPLAVFFALGTIISAL